MTMDRTHELLKLTQAEVPDGRAMQAAAGPLLEWTKGASPDERTEALRLLREAFTHHNIGVGGFVATVCGAMIEEGADPKPIVDHLTKVLQLFADPAVLFHRAVASNLPEPAVAERDGVDLHGLFEREAASIAQQMPQGEAAWHGLQAFGGCAVAVLSRDASAREALRDRQPLLRELSIYHQAAHWMGLLCGVRDGEPLLVIEPATKTGIVGTVSGVVVNFQLNMLIMDGFPRAEGAEARISPAAAAVARGEGPQAVDETVTGTWNLYTCQALGEDLSLPKPQADDAQASWIWNEGALDDVPTFEGKRVVLLGPPTYARSWPAQRMFDALPARIVIDDELGPDQVRELLERMRASLDV